MNIHEFQAKELMRKFGINVLKGEVAKTVEEAVDIAKKLKGDKLTLPSALTVLAKQIGLGEMAACNHCIFSGVLKFLKSINIGTTFSFCSESKNHFLL